MSLRDAARRVRERIIELVYRSGSGHVGTALGEADILVALYLHGLRVDPRRPDWDERDRFVLSKGHGGLGLIAVLAELGFVGEPELADFGKTGAALGMHMDRTRVPGIEVSTGSLGHGLGQAVGMAIGARLLGRSWRTVCLLSDGELYEGSTWEAALAGAGHRLGRLVAIVDRNRMTMDGQTEQVLPLEPVAAKWEAFGWRALRCDGHDLDALCAALDLALAGGDRPTVIVAETVKGKGVDFMENAGKWHYGALDSADYQRARESIARLYGDAR
ncbi:MAG TPA: transketolase [Kofleriaceae bacterium]|nr:transketolase [Kofleriaceae bacterium]